MSIFQANSQKEIDEPEDFEGFEDKSTEDENIESAYYDEENPAYDEVNELNDSDESTEFLEGFQEGVERDGDALDDQSPDAAREDNISY